MLSEALRQQLRELGNSDAMIDLVMSEFEVSYTINKQ
jgi:hypothetical protein